jgi:hypothetical protein
MAKSLKTQETRNQEYVVEDINKERQGISWRVNEFDRGFFAFCREGEYERPAARCTKDI